jgi:hypothetical protein
MPLFVLSVRANAREAEAKLDALGRKQIPFAASQAVNRLARQALADLKSEMARVFDRPTPFTLNAFAWKKSTKRSLSAEIFAREFAGKGTPGWKYLTPEVFGGSRALKRFERALKGKIGSGFAVPGHGAPLNAFGNMSPGQIEKILSALGAAEGRSGYRANRRGRGKGLRRDEKYFIAHSKQDGSILGIYKVVSAGKVEPVLIFPRRAPSYRKRFPFHETVEKSFAANREAAFTQALAEAIATAK